MLLISDRLTPDGIEAHQRNKKESIEYCQKLFRKMEQIDLFSLDMLVNMATAAGLHIELRILDAA